MEKKYCPLMTIGFGPPEKGQKDMRLCKVDCAWFDETANNCRVNIIAENLNDTAITLADLFDNYLAYQELN